jgi:shikimate dehydrogenase
LTDSPVNRKPRAVEYPGRLVLLGNPVSHSLSPTFQNAALRAAKIPLEYEALAVTKSELQPLLRDLRKVSGAGNVTIPHKFSVSERCDELTEIAARVGAVNTFWVAGGRLHGDNTDVGGFDAAARALLGAEPSGARVVLLGAGGAAAAILAAAEAWPGAAVSIVARNAARAEALARRFPDVARVETSAKRVIADATLIVNATPVGQREDEQPLDVSMISRSTAVMDLVYARGGTSWIRAARAHGNRAADGLTMLLEQGALSFQRWFGIEPDREAMRRSLQ